MCDDPPDQHVHVAGMWLCGPDICVMYCNGDAVARTK